MKKQFLKEVKQFQKIAGILKETWHPDDPSQPGDDGPETDPDDFDDISEGRDAVEVFNFGYDLEAIDALSKYIKSKYHVVNQQDDTTGADAAEWVERGDTTMNALEIYNPAILKDPMFKKLLQNCEGKGYFDDDDMNEN